MWYLLLIIAFQASAIKLGPTGPIAPPTICDQATLLFPALLGEITSRQAGQFCFDKTYTAIVSDNCKSKCGLIEKAKADKKPLEYSQNGTPGSWLCKRYGGKAKVLYLEHKGQRQKQSFCLAGDEVISTPYLLQSKSR